MSLPEYASQSVGNVASKSTAFAKVLNDAGVDFCCHGSDNFSEACRKAGADPEKVAKELDSVVGVPAQMSHDFNTWPTDLLSDYVLKVHHRGIRQVRPKILDLLAKVVEVHGPNHPELHEIQSLFQQTMVDLTNHLMKEEMMLYPFIYQLCDGDLNHHSVQAFHCGSVESPIGVMEAEHEEEGQRQKKIRQLTNDYTPPADACGSLKLTYALLKQFKDDLHEHIHLENNLIFPRALEIESRVVER